MKRWVLVAALLLLPAFPAGAGERLYALRVDGMACPYCAYGVEKKIKTLDGVVRDSIDIRLDEGRVVFRADTDAAIPERKLKQLINDAGFTLRGLATEPATGGNGN